MNSNVFDMEKLARVFGGLYRCKDELMGVDKVLGSYYLASIPAWEEFKDSRVAFYQKDNRLWLFLVTKEKQREDRVLDLILPLNQNILRFFRLSKDTDFFFVERQDNPLIYQRLGNEKIFEMFMGVDLSPIAVVIIGYGKGINRFERGWRETIKLVKKSFDNLFYRIE